jgi:RecA-family ATPase
MWEVEMGSRQYAIEVLSRILADENVVVDPERAGDYLDLILEIRDTERSERMRVLGVEAPDLVEEVRRWSRNPGLYSLVSKAVSHNHLLHTDPPEVDWVIEDVLEGDGVAMFYGASGIGKTFFALHMAACIGSGKDWLGHKTNKRRVLYLDGENGCNLIHRRARMLGYEDADVTYISFPQIVLDDDGLRMLRLLIDEMGVDVVIIDPLVNSMQGDENSVEYVRPQLKGLREVAAETGTAVVVIHHENRQGGYRGSSVLRDLVTLQARISRDANRSGGDTYCINVEPKKQRESRLKKTAYVWFVEDGRYKCGLLSDKEARRDYTDDIVEAVSELGNPSKRELIRAREIHGLSQARARDAIEAAVNQGVIGVRVGSHNRHELHVC